MNIKFNKKSYVRNHRHQLSWLNRWRMKNEKFKMKNKYVIIITAILASLTSFLIINHRQDTTPRFTRQIVGAHQYQGEIKGVMKTSFAKEKDKAVIEVERNNSKLSFNLPIENASLVAKDNIISPSTISYETKDKNIEVNYSLLPNGLKEEIVLNKIPNENKFPVSLKTENLEMKINSGGVPVFYSNSGEYQFHFERPYVVDGAGNKSYAVKYLFKDNNNQEKPVESLFQSRVGKNIKQSLMSSPTNPYPLTPNPYSLIIEVDSSWLHDPHRVLPIIIDPTVVHDTMSEFATGQLNRLKDTGSSSSPSLETHYQESLTDQYTIGLWHMNETANDTCSGGQDACDSSGNGYHGTATNTTITTTDQKLGAAARSFNGSSDSISLAKTSTVKNLSKYTLSAWVKPSSFPTSTAHYIYYESVADSSTYVRTMLTTANEYQGCSGNKFLVSFRTGAAASTRRNLCSTTTPIANQWYHLVFTFDSDADIFQIYVNGVLDNTLAVSESAVANTDPTDNITIGSGVSAAYFPGVIDEMRVDKITRTPEEIKLAASRRPYSVYTSDVIDLAYVASWNSFSWTELGVATGDGETLKDDTSLVAQWNLNETSGTTADNAEGTSALDGTLTNFASTGSQDAAAGTGWTANNKRWGAGALMFDGSDDHIVVSDQSAIDFTTALTLETWVKPSTINHQVNFINKQGSSTDRAYILYAEADNLPRFAASTNGSSLTVVTASTQLNSGQWYHIVSTYDGSNIKIYINGRLEQTAALSGSLYNCADQLEIGLVPGWATQYVFAGVMDSTRLYSRALAAAEIMSNYQAGNIELQTRVGSDSTPDDGSWDAWSPISGETTIDAMDYPYQYSTSSSNLVSYWPMDETVNDSCSGSEDVCDQKGTNHGTVTGTTITDGYFGKARYFGGSSSHIITVTDSTDFTFGTNDFTVETWVNPRTITGNYEGILGTFNGTDNGFILTTSYGTDGHIAWWNTTNGWIDTGVSLTLNTWQHLVVTRTSGQINIYLDGRIINTTNSWSGNIDGSNLIIGGWSASYAYFTGMIDEVRFYNTAISAAIIKQNYLEGSTQTNNLHISTDTIIKQEGSASEKIESGKPLVDGNIVGLWHLDETGGSGAYVKDSSGNNNHGTPTGTSVVQGISDKARYFNGSSDYISTTTSYSNPTSFSLELWFKTTTASGKKLIGFESSQTGTGSSSYDRHIWMGTDGKIYFGIYDANPDIKTRVSNNVLNDGAWHHVVGTFASNSISLYIDGVIQGSSLATSTISNYSGYWRIGSYKIAGWTNALDGYFTGYIDEVKVSNVARTAEEIAESYRAGRDHYINKTITSTDLSSKTTLPFYVAADRPGTYLEATVGESAYANYQPDTSTVGLWHLSEQTGYGAYLKDSSGNSNHGTPTNATYVHGKIGKARNFAGTQYITLGDNTSLRMVGSSGTWQAWVRPSSVSGERKIIDKRSAWNSLYGYSFFVSNTNIYFEYGNGSSYTQYGTALPGYAINQWFHLVATMSSGNINIYVNGQKIASTTGVTSIAGDSTSAAIGDSIGRGVGGYSFLGIIDEVRVDNTARTADEIRQAYEVGLRTHPITIDFASAISHSDSLFNSTDLGFTLMATPSGYTNPGDFIYEGDKIIVRENYDGTEYLAQGTVDSVNVSTGATTVSAWDTGSTFPSAGYTPNASVFKWQREYFNITEPLDSHLNATTNITLRLTNGNEGRTIWLDDFRSAGDYLTTASGSTITSNTGNRYFQYRAIIHSFDEAVAATLSAVTLDYESNAVPNTPSLDLPVDSATNQSVYPALKTTATDDDSDYLRYKIQMCEDSGMTTNCQTFDQTSSQTGWSGQDAESSTAYASGTQAVYTIQSILTTNKTYYWRSYAIDPGGKNTWSSTQGSPYSFTTTHAPSSPTTPYCEGASNPSGIIDLTPEFSAVNSDADADSVNYYQIQVNTASGFDGTEMWDSGKQSMTSTANGVRSPDISYAGTALSYDGTTYYWRIKFWDTNSAEGVWSDTQNFSTNSPPNTPSLDYPSDTATGISTMTNLKTTATDDDSDYLRYKILLCTNSSLTQNCQTFDQTSSQTGWSGQDAESDTAYASGTQAVYYLQTPLIVNTTYYWKSYTIDPGGTNTWSLTQTSPYSFTISTTTSIPTKCRVTKATDNSSLTVKWLDNATNEINYELQKSTDGAGFVTYQTLSSGTTSYTDTSVGSGHTYQYKIAAIFTGSVYSSWCTTSKLDLQTGSSLFEGIKLEGIKLN